MLHLCSLAGFWIIPWWMKIGVPIFKLSRSIVHGGLWQKAVCYSTPRGIVFSLTNWNDKPHYFTICPDGWLVPVVRWYSVFDPVSTCYCNLVLDSLVYSVSWSSDGSRLKSGSFDKTVRISSQVDVKTIHRLIRTWRLLLRTEYSVVSSRMSCTLSIVNRVTPL